MKLKLYISKYTMLLWTFKVHRLKFSMESLYQANVNLNYQLEIKFYNNSRNGSKIYQIQMVASNALVFPKVSVRHGNCIVDVIQR